MNDLIKKIPHLLTREELKLALSKKPFIHINQNTDLSERLIQLTDIMNAYFPTEMSFDIYETLYFSLVRSFQRKAKIFDSGSIKYVSQGHNALDTCVITGEAGVGKTATTRLCIDVIGNRPIEIYKPFYAKIVPFVFIEASSTNSMKSFLLNIMYELDKSLHTTLYEANNNQAIYVESLMNAVSRTLMTSVGVVVIDEADRFLANKKSLTMINFITQLINQSGISVIFLGTNREIFTRTKYLCRRSLGEDFKAFNYNDEFISFMSQLFEFQYTKKAVKLTSEIAILFHKLTNGITALIITLFYNAQKATIEADRDALDVWAINYAFQKKMSPYNAFLKLVKIENRKSNEVIWSKDIVEGDFQASKQQPIFKDASSIANKDADKFISILRNQISVEVIKC